ncbi:MAG: ACP S-malonyltransferase [Candidatus Rokubacteria bacterium]|nr:ACP S-malonyltransferase [Candidatus Rokubacteria bacterium]
MSGARRPLVYLFPGQGSQAVGMAGEFVRQRPAAAALVERADRLLGRGLSRLMLRGPAAELTRTENQQVAVCVAEAVCLAALRAAEVPEPVAVAGHSLGELAACHAAGALDFDQLVALAAERGRLMATAARAAPGGMLALAPVTDGEIARLAMAAGAAGAVVVANLNAPAQVVLSGPGDALAAVERVARAEGRRTTWLPVSGPWHSPAMTPAARAFGEVLARTPLRDPRVPVWSALDGTPQGSAASLRARLASQIDQPVRWVETVRALRAAHPGVAFVEVGPGRVLTGLLRAIDPRCEVLRVDGPATLTATLRVLGAAAREPAAAPRPS